MTVRRSVSRVLIGSAGVLAAIGIWDLAVRTGAVRAELLPSPTETFAALGTMLLTPEAWAAIGHTSQQWLSGMAISCVIAIPLGLILGRSRVVRSYSRSTIDFLRAVPTIALLPLFVLVFGSGLQMVALLITYSATWQLLIPTMTGAAAVDVVAIETARSFRLGRFRTFIRVILPASLPYIATGLRYAATIALLVAVGAELIVGSPGIGREMITAGAGGRADRLYALCILTGLIGVLLNLAFRNSESLYLGWTRSGAEQKV